MNEKGAPPGKKSSHAMTGSGSEEKYEGDTGGASRSESTSAGGIHVVSGLHLGLEIRYAPGVGERRGEAFARLGVRTVADLVKHLPHRYEFEAAEGSIKTLCVGSVGTVRGMIVKCRWVSQAGGRRGVKGRFEATIRDESGYLDVVWFNARYLKDKLHPSMSILLIGKVQRYADGKQMANPQWRLVDAEAPEQRVTERYRPVYPATEDLTSPQIERIVADVLPRVLREIEDHFDDAYRDAHALMSLREAYRVLHAPEDEDQVKAARRRLAYDELLLLQLGFALKRKYNQTTLRAHPLKWTQAGDRQIRDRFPFELTPGQEKVIKEMVADLKRDEPMNRLVQGDVGSGKTVVALYAMLMAVLAGKQAAMMAPTELLAEQHYASIARMLRDSVVRLGVLTGSQTKAERQAMRRRILRGEVDIVIGTQALLTESVTFADLAVVVIDEQHRFGVMQRLGFRGKAEAAADAVAPHCLVMTATPIPRTLSLTLFGDLEVSTIEGLPPGRQPIVTRVVPTETSEKVYHYVADRVRAGEQCYVVVPTVEEGAQGLKAVRTHARQLEQAYFSELRVAPLHGQMKSVTREKVMDRFRRGGIDVLVATTVIEVGVDVPNASLMIVEHADRFGLAQLHQLRGRVGRGSKKSLCVFIHDASTEEAAQRLDAIERTTDGFAIAEADLLIRGMGDFFGTRQSGTSTLKVARLPHDLKLLTLARRDARKLVDDDPTLSAAKHRLLRARLLKQYGQTLGLGDVG